MASPSSGRPTTSIYRQRDSFIRRSTNLLRDFTMTLRSLTNERRDYLVGMVLLIIAVFLWIFGGFIAQDIFERGYEKPFLITWFKASSFTLYLVPTGLKRLWGARDGSCHERRSGYERLTDDPTPRNYTTGDDSDLTPCADQLPPLTAKETLRVAVIFCFLWFTSTWFYVWSFNFTSVSSTMIMASMASFFTLGIGRALKVESLTMTKIVVVAISFIGILLVSLSDSSGSSARDDPPGAPEGVSKIRRFVGGYSNPLLGDSFALLTAVLFAVYLVLLKVRIGQESRVDMQLFFGFLGACTILFLWPVGFILHFTGVETFELPSERRVIVDLLLNIFVTVVADFIHAIALLKTTPLVMSVGGGLTIPVAIAGDFLFGKTITLMSLFGASLVIGSFIVLGVESAKVEGVPAEVVAEDGTGIRLRMSSEDHPAA